jgi:hypothetical protein
MPWKEKSFENPRKRWLDDIENGLKKMGVRGWRNIAKDRDAWKLTLKETMFLHKASGESKFIMCWQ